MIVACGKSRGCVVGACVCVTSTGLCLAGLAVNTGPHLLYSFTWAPLPSTIYSVLCSHDHLRILIEFHT